MLHIFLIRRVVLSSVAVLTLLVPAALHAQTLPPGTKAPVDHNQTISANPFALMFRYFNAEYERKHTETSTFGVSASFLPFDDANYGNVQVFYRYYPQNAALSGFYIGGRGGGHRVSVDEASGAFFGIGVELGYNWLLGKERNFSVGMGASVTRLFGGSLDGVSLTLPAVRLVNVGWSF